MSKGDSERLAAAADRIEIIDALARFHHAVDSKDWTLLGALFADDVIGHYPDAPQSEAAGPGHDLLGRQEIVRWLASILGTVETFHSMTNHVIDLDGSTAKSRSYVASYFAGTYGTFECDWRWREDEGWRMAEYTLIHLQPPATPEPAMPRKDT